MRRLGVDPGSAYVAATILDGDVVPCTYVDSLTREVGRMVPRDAPKPLLLRDGGPKCNAAGEPIILTHRRAAPTDEEIDILAAEIAAWALAHGVTRAAVEEVTDVHFDPSMGDAGKSSMAGALVRSGKVGAVVALRLRDAGIAVVRVRHATWAGRIAKSAGVKPKQVKPVIVAAVAGWPTQTNEHERDAAGCALWDVVVAAEEEAARNAPPKAPRAPRVRVYVPRKSQPSRAVKAQREATRAARDAAGCACVKRHRIGCPLYVPNTATCHKCHGPMRGHLRGLPCPPLPIETPMPP